MPTTTLHLIRHAEPEPAGGDPGLTAFGRHRSAEVAQALRSIPPGAILHSPARRAIETATIQRASDTGPRLLRFNASE